MGCGCGKKFTKATPNGQTVTNLTPEPNRSGQSSTARVIKSAPIYMPKPGAQYSSTRQRV